jgi:hypothetical protein
MPAPNIKTRFWAACCYGRIAAQAASVLEVPPMRSTAGLFRGNFRGLRHRTKRSETESTSDGSDEKKPRRLERG